MRCFFCKNLLSDYLDGNLDGSLDQEIKGHLESCQHCNAYYKELKAAKDISNKVPLLDPGNTFYSNIKDTINGNSWFNKLYRRFVVPANVKLPLIFLIVLTVAILISFILVQRNKVIYLSKITLDMLHPENKENSIAAKSKEKLKAYVNALVPTLGAGDEKEEALDKEKLVAQAQEAQNIVEENKQEAQIQDDSSSEELEPQTSVNNLVFKIFINTVNLNEDSKNILALLEKHEIKSALNSEVVSIEPEGAYFHFYVPQKNYPNLLKELKSTFKVTVVKEESSKTVTNFRYRVVIWVQNLRKE